MEERYDIFFDLLASQLGGRALDGNIVDRLSADMARSVYSLAKSQDMAHKVNTRSFKCRFYDSKLKAQLLVSHKSY